MYYFVTIKENKGYRIKTITANSEEQAIEIAKKDYLPENIISVSQVQTNK